MVQYIPRFIKKDEIRLSEQTCSFFTYRNVVQCKLLELFRCSKYIYEKFSNVTCFYVISLIPPCESAVLVISFL